MSQSGEAMMSPSAVERNCSGRIEEDNGGSGDHLASSSPAQATNNNGLHSPTRNTNINNNNRKPVESVNSNPNYSCENVDSDGCSKTSRLSNTNERTENHDRTNLISDSLIDDSSNLCGRTNLTCNSDSLIEKINGDEGHCGSLSECVGAVPAVELTDLLDLETELDLVSRDELLALTPDALWEKWQQQQCLVGKLLAKLRTSRARRASQDICDGDDELRECNLRLKTQVSEAQRKEAYHIMRLTAKEHELQEMAASVAASKVYSIGRGCLLDPAVNLCMERLKRDLEAARTKMEEAQNELAAWKFTPDSNTGKQLMAKCRLLIKENEELGRVISSGKLSKLEGDIALQRNFTEELKKSQSELDEFLLEMDEDTEGMQGTILYLQKQLRLTKQQLQQSQQQHQQSPAPAHANTPTPPPSAATNNSTLPKPAPAEQSPVPIAAETKVDATTLYSENEEERCISEDSNGEAIHSSQQSFIESNAIEPENSVIIQPIHEPVFTETKKQSSLSTMPVSGSSSDADGLQMLSTSEDAAVLASVESMIIPNDKFKSVIDQAEMDSNLSNGSNKRRLGAADDGTVESDDGVVEPLCKRTRVSVLGDDGEEATALTNQANLENGLSEP